ncbi:MAG: type VII toxin-antitoxin system MntA family adenylyltransferase antitoxin [Tangfeifania sp.]
MDKKQTEKKITEFLKRKIPGLLGIYIYGSFAENRMRPDSDIDIAFLTWKKISAIDKWKIQEELASLLDNDIDLVDLKDASVVLRAEVVENGTRIYTENEYECDNFEVTTYSMYADLNETRKDILNDIEENIKCQKTNNK